MTRRSLRILTLLPFLSACGFSGGQLRSDVAEFLSGFSLEGAIAAYKEAGYEKTVTAVEGDKTTVTTEAVDFNATDVMHPTYQMETETRENDQVTESSLLQILEKDGAFVKRTEEGESPSSLDECHANIEKFFYQEVAADAVHLYGMYYGDYIRQMAASLQELVTIDLENQLYRYHARSEYTNTAGATVLEEQTYVVDNYGMLVENTLVRESALLTVTTHITTYHR